MEKLRDREPRSRCEGSCNKTQIHLTHFALNAPRTKIGKAAEKLSGVNTDTLWDLTSYDIKNRGKKELRNKHEFALPMYQYNWTFLTELTHLGRVWDGFGTVWDKLSAVYMSPAH